MWMKRPTRLRKASIAIQVSSARYAVTSTTQSASTVASARAKQDASPRSAVMLSTGPVQDTGVCPRFTVVTR
jgi:hypothetical protein